YFRPEEAEEYEAAEVEPSYPLRCFLSRQKAEAHCREVEVRERHEVDIPFRYGGEGTDLADYSTLPFEEFRSRLQALGLPGPVSRRRRSYAWQNLWEWWEQNGGQLTPAQFDAVWGMLDRIHFFQVAEVKVPLVGETVGRAAAANITRLYVVEMPSWEQC